MKTLLTAAVVLILASCNNATDGDPTTDTSNMPRDTAMGLDTSNHINRSDGTVPADSSLRNSEAVNRRDSMR